MAKRSEGQSKSNEKPILEELEFLKLQTARVEGAVDQLRSWVEDLQEKVDLISLLVKQKASKRDARWLEEDDEEAAQSSKAQRPKHTGLFAQDGVTPVRFVEDVLNEQLRASMGAILKKE